MSTERNPMSKEAYDRKKAELDRMKNEDMTRIAEQIAAARAFGDLSENAEYDAAREAQGMLQAKINVLQEQLALAFIVDKAMIKTDRVAFGAKVKVLDLDFKEEEEFILVGLGDEDYDKNKILVNSPIGQGLLGKQVGEEASIAVPRGTLRLRVLEIGLGIE